MVLRQQGCSRNSPEETSAFSISPKYMIVIGWGMVFLIWMYLRFRESSKRTCHPGSEGRVKGAFLADWRDLTRDQLFVIACVVLVVLGMATSVLRAGPDRTGTEPPSCSSPRCSFSCSAS